MSEAPLTGTSGTSFCAIFEPRAMLKIGDTTEVALDLSRLHFFDPETDASLLAEDEPEKKKKPEAKKK